MFINVIHETYNNVKSPIKIIKCGFDLVFTKSLFTCMLKTYLHKDGKSIILLKKRRF